MAATVTAGQIDKEEVSVTINVKMPLKEWRIFYTELINQSLSKQVKIGLKNIFDNMIS